MARDDCSLGGKVTRTARDMERLGESPRDEQAVQAGGRGMGEYGVGRKDEA